MAGAPCHLTAWKLQLSGVNMAARGDFAPQSNTAETVLIALECLGRWTAA